MAESEAIGSSSTDSVSKVYRLEGLDNYDRWKIKLMFHAQGRQLWSYIDGTAMLPDRPTPNQIEKYRNQDQRALAILCDAVNERYLHFFQSVEGTGTVTAHDVYSRITAHFDNKGLDRHRQAHHQLHTTKLEEDHSRRRSEAQRMELHLSNLQRLRQKVINMGHDVSDSEFVFIILESLPPSYKNTVENISVQPDAILSDEDFVYGKLMLIARRRDEQKGVQTFYNGNGSGEQVVLQSRAQSSRCYACNRVGHYARDCLNPSNQFNYDNRGNSRGRGGFNAEYRGGGRNGHRSGFRGGRNRGGRFNRAGHTRRGRGRAFRRGGYQPITMISVAAANAAGTLSDGSQKFIIDSGATAHMCADRTQMIEYTPFPTPQIVRLGDASSVEAFGTGTVPLIFSGLPGGDVKINLTEVLYVPDLGLNLMSVVSVTANGYTVEFGGDQCYITDAEGTLLAVGELMQGHLLYQMFSRPNSEVLDQASAATTEACRSQDDDDHKSDEEDEGDVTAAITMNKVVNQLQLDHERLGHISHRYLRSMQFHNMVHGLKFPSSDRGTLCRACVKGKQTKSPKSRFPGRTTKRRLELVHSDVCDMAERSRDGKRYLLLFIDDHTRKVKHYVLREKSEVLSKFIEFEAEVRNQTGDRIQRLRCDNGGEYVNEEFDEFLREKGIIREPIVPHNPNQNGVAERMNRTMVEMIRTTLYHAGLSHGFWPEAAANAENVRNKVLTQRLRNKTPHEMWTGKKPNIQNIRTFGCKCYVHIPGQNRRKLDPKSMDCILLGSLDNGGYKLYNPETGRIFSSRDVIFDEESLRQARNEEHGGPVEDNDSSSDTSETSEDEPDRANENNQDAEAAPPLRRSERLKAKSEQHEAQVVRTPIVETILNAQVDGPTTISEALNGPDAEKWLEALKSEYRALMDNKTWELVHLPKDRKTIGQKWVLTIKRKPDGSIERYKARLVCKGFSQRYPQDYTETYSPVLFLESMRLLVGLATASNMLIHQLDVATAFLNGQLNEEIYMDQPEGFEVAGQEDKVCKLKKSLYGLKQSPRCWNDEINTFLMKEGFQRSSADHCLYFRQKEGNTAYIGLYVDDIIVATSTQTDMTKIKDALKKRYKMKDMGPIDYILGIKIEREAGFTFLHQSKYAEDILEKVGMTNSRPVTTPREANTTLPKRVPEEEPVDQTAYQSIVGSLMYLSSATRPDLANAVNAAAQHNSNPGPEHWIALKRILRYLRGTHDYGIAFGGSDAVLKLRVYCDADYANDPSNRRSTSGYTVEFAGGPIAWCARKQPTVAISTTESEYVALSVATQEVMWLRQMLKSIGIPQSDPTTIQMDNQSAICLASNPGYHHRTKHIDVKHHHAREAVQNGLIEITYCPSALNVADIFTKGLQKQKFEELRDALGVRRKEDTLQAGPSRTIHHAMTATALSFKSIAPTEEVTEEADDSEDETEEESDAKTTDEPDEPEAESEDETGATTTESNPKRATIKTEEKKKAKKKKNKQKHQKAKKRVSAFPTYIPNPFRYCNLWFLLLFLIGILASAHGQGAVKQYQYCGGEKLNSRVIALTQLGSYKPLAQLSPTLAARMTFSRSNVAGQLLESGQVEIWDCPMISAQDKYEFEIPDTPDDGKLYKTPEYKEVVNLATGKSLFVHPSGELVMQSPPSTVYILTRANSGSEPPAETAKERAIIRKWSDPVLDGKLLATQASKIEYLEQNLKEIGRFINDRTFGQERVQLTEFLPFTSTKSTMSTISNYVLNGNVQMIINVCVVAIMIGFILRFFFLVCKFMACAKAVFSCCCIIWKACVNPSTNIPPEYEMRQRGRAQRQAGHERLLY